MKKVNIYSTPTCGYCKMAKEFSDDTKDFDSLPEKVNEGTKCWKGYEKKGMKTICLGEKKAVGPCMTALCNHIAIAQWIWKMYQNMCI